MVPSVSLGLHLGPSEFQVSIKWWLPLEVVCSLCPEVALDPIQFSVSEVEMQ